MRYLYFLPATAVERENRYFRIAKPESPFGTSSIEWNEIHGCLALPRARPTFGLLRISFSIWIDMPGGYGVGYWICIWVSAKRQPPPPILNAETHNSSQKPLNQRIKARGLEFRWFRFHWLQRGDELSIAKTNISSFRLPPLNGMERMGFQWLLPMLHRSPCRLPTRGGFRQIPL